MRFPVIAALLLCSASSGLTQTAPLQPKSNPPSYDSEAIIIEQSDTVVRYNADGTGDKTHHVRMKLQSEAGVHQYSVLSFPFASANETAQIQSLRVVHPDGSSIETPVTDAMELPSPITQQIPFYSDLKELRIPVRGLRVGDTLEYRLLIQRKNAESPGQFWGSYVFVKEAVVLAQSFTLDIPADKYLQVWSPKLKPSLSETAGRRVYQWTGSQLNPTHSAEKKDKDAVEPPSDKKPLIGLSSEI
jgi:hypothetical protein